MLDIFNEMELYLIENALNDQRDREVEELQKLIKENPNKRPIFTEDFIKMQHDQLLEKVKRNTKIKKHGE